MKKPLIFIVTLLALALLFSGCTYVPVVTVEAPPMATLPQAVDLSEYIIKEEKPTQEAVPLDSELNYMDTSFLMKLMSFQGATSQERTSYDQYSPEWSFVLVDSRPAESYNEGHINGAINIPDAQFDQFKHLLPADKSKIIIFYCGGLHCPLSGSSAKKAMELGYTNVYVYQEGTPAWKAAGNYFVTTPDYVADLITADRMNDTKADPIMIIDSRPYSSYFDGHIPNAVNMDDGLFVEKYLEFMPQDKNTEIITYCGGFFCSKSHFVAKVLVSNGYTNVKVMAGGAPAWKKAGFPLFGAEASGGKFDITGGKPDRRLTPADFTKKLQAGGSVVVIDVRTAEERAGGAIPGSTHIPDKDILANPHGIVSLLPANKNTTLLIHCASGARAAGVVEKIADLGYANTFYLNSPIIIKPDGSYSF